MLDLLLYGFGILVLFGQAAYFLAYGQIENPADENRVGAPS